MDPWAEFAARRARANRQDDGGCAGRGVGSLQGDSPQVHGAPGVCGASGNVQRSIQECELTLSQITKNLELRN